MSYESPPWRIECPDDITFDVVGREDAEHRFWDAVTRSQLEGVWKLLRPDGQTFLTVMVSGPARLPAWRLRLHRDLRG